MKIMNKKSLRLGDMVAKLTKALHIPHCEKCEKRRLILDEIQNLGIAETVLRLKAVGVSVQEGGESKAVEGLVKELEGCCDH